MDGRAVTTTFVGSLECQCYATMKSDAKERLQKDKEKYLARVVCYSITMSHCSNYLMICAIRIDQTVKMSMDRNEQDMLEFMKSMGDIQCYEQNYEK